MSWLLIMALNGVEIPVNKYENVRDCSYSLKARHQFYLNSNADMKDKQDTVFKCKAIERKTSSNH